jgi:DNA-binding NarL/FixJ family response regulator
MKIPIKIGIADDHPMVIRGIRNMLEDYPNIEILQVFSNGKEVLQGLKNATPDVLLLDIHMPGMNGDELLPLIRESFPNLSVLILTNIEQAEWVQRMMNEGASGYLLKSTDQQTLVTAIEKVHAGKEYIDSQLKEAVLEYMLREQKKAAALPSISRREKEVLKLIVEGCTNQQIAEQLFLGLRTIETYRLNLMTKLNVKNTASLVRKAIEDQLIN